MAQALEVQICLGCNRALPASPEFFRIDRRNVHGITGKCRECLAAMDRARRLRCERCGGPRQPRYSLCATCRLQCIPRVCQVGLCREPAESPHARWCEFHAPPWGEP